MTPAQLEIRAAAYLCAALLFIALGVRLGMHHVQAQWNIDKLAQSSAIEAQQQKILEVTQQRDALQNQVEQSHAQIIASGTALVGNVSTSLRAVEAALRSGPLSATVVHTGAVQNAINGAAIPSELAAAIGRTNAAIEDVAAACVKVDADRTAIIQLEPKAAP
jgi:hypothetical protein